MIPAVGDEVRRTMPNGMGASLTLRSLSLVALLIVALLAPQALNAQSAPPVVPQYLAPTVPGAPFLPVADRTTHVIERYEALTALSELEQARTALSDRVPTLPNDDLLQRSELLLQRSLSQGAGGSLDHDSLESAAADEQALAETERILDAQISSLQRSLDALVEAEQPLLDEMAPFGIGLAVFPVDEVRKPFWDDWGQPRSGGRRHAGTDVLAQIGVPLRAIEDGTVETISSGGLGGKGIFLLGESGSRYFFTHMDQLADLEPGDTVLAGQPVGTVGDTGNARGAPHLHMQWAPNGGSDWQNPFPMLDTLFGAGRTTEFADTAAELLLAEAQELAEAEDLAEADGANS